MSETLQHTMPTPTTLPAAMPATTPTPMLAAAQARIATLRPAAYARTRNALNGAVSGLSPYITHGIVSLPEVLAGVLRGLPPDQDLSVQHKFVYELGWRAYFRQVWRQRGDGILQSIHPGPMPDAAYACQVPDDVRQARTGVPVIDQAVRTLYATGLLHNHARMWLASYLVHVRHVHWRSGADWLYSHFLDGDLASNHLSWQWVAGTASRKPYLFNAENVARYAPPHWHSPGTVIDTPYEQLDSLAHGRTALDTQLEVAGKAALQEPPVMAAPPVPGMAIAPAASLVAGREVWLLHPWCLAAPPGLPDDTLVLAVYIAEHHRAWPWSGLRWGFVGERMSELTPHCWYGEAAAIGAALAGARRVRTVHDPHLAAWLPRWAECLAAPALFPPVAQHCESFSQWWSHSTRGLQKAAELLAVNEVPAW